MPSSHFLRRPARPVALAFTLLTAAIIASAQLPPTPPDTTPRLALLIPVGPPDYAVILDAFHSTHDETDGPFRFRAGTIGGVPVVLSIAPVDGPLARSLAAEEMLHHFNIKAFLYAGTSGGHLNPSEMRVGDIVLGAKNVDFTNFFMARDGSFEVGSFASVQPTIKHYDSLYADPILLGFMACSAKRVASATELPAWINGKLPRLHPDIFYFGVQGTGTIWMADKGFIDRTMAVFHEIDEDGDWYSNLVATLYHVPFIEVSIIANSTVEFPATSHGLPVKPASEPVGSSVIAQRLSNRIALDLVEHFGPRMLKGSFTTPETDPFPAGVYDHPKDSRNLLQGLDCH